MATLYKAIGDSELSENASIRVLECESVAIVDIRHASGISRMKAIVEEALAEDEGIDLGPLSHEERLKLLTSC